jgi:hypothetical protein
MPYAIFTQSFQDLNTSINDIHNFIMMNAKGRPLNLHMQFSNLGVYTWVRKWTWLCLCESPSNPWSKYGFHFQEPNISSTSICAILVVKYKFGAYFKIMFTICFKSPNWIALHNKSSFLSSPWFDGPSFLKWYYNVVCLKAWT